MPLVLVHQLKLNFVNQVKLIQGHGARGIRHYDYVKNYTILRDIKKKVPVY